MIEFQPFPKISRLSRQAYISEKIDGTNATIHLFHPAELVGDEPEEFKENIITIDHTMSMLVGSRNQWIGSGKKDNHGFWAWCNANKDQLVTLGYGTHRGEWWGKGIQRGYGLTEKRFSLFNTSWETIPGTEYRSAVCPVCHVVPLMRSAIFNTEEADYCLKILKDNGSLAAPGYGNPEGIVVFHEHSQTFFKKTLDKNDEHKG